ncbi:MAG TPA: methionyl-tRNA formyltransferase [bacterium]|jgi:methionyl-tRNA formyltransferase|nr:methionyl-tRNA formyltransferase [bacterium]
MKIFFAGTDVFAQPILEGLIKDKHYDILRVITKPAKPAGRGLMPQANPILGVARRFAIKTTVLDKKQTWEPVNKAIKKEKPDCVVVAALGLIIPESTLSLLPHRFINIHPSLLPQYRGPSPIEAAILNEEKTTGTSLIVLTPKMDAGPVIAQEEVALCDNDNAFTLQKKLSELSFHLLKKHLARYLTSKQKATPQIETKATYTHIITKQDGLVDLTQPPQTIITKMRAYIKWPGVFFFAQKHLYKIIKARAEQDRLVIEKIQPAGKKIMTAREFLNGHRAILTAIPKNVIFDQAQHKLCKERLNAKNKIETGGTKE